MSTETPTREKSFALFGNIKSMCSAAQRRRHRQIESPMRRLFRALPFGECVQSVRRLGNAQLLDQLFPVLAQEGDAVERGRRGSDTILLELVSDVGLLVIKAHIRVGA